MPSHYSTSRKSKHKDAQPNQVFQRSKEYFRKKKIYSFVLRGFFFFMGFGSFGHLVFFFLLRGFWILWTFGLWMWRSSQNRRPLVASPLFFFLEVLVVLSYLFSISLQRFSIFLVQVKGEHIKSMKFISSTSIGFMCHWVTFFVMVIWTEL